MPENLNRGGSINKLFEQEWLVRLSNYCPATNQKTGAKKLWEFHHPNPEIYDKKVEIYDKSGNLIDLTLPYSNHNDRFSSVTFKTSYDGIVIHGFAGYFECLLYESTSPEYSNRKVMMSINPGTHTVSMISWFPLFFPLRPDNLLKNWTCDQNDLCINFWRKSRADSVWYEWCVTEPVAGDIHNFTPEVMKLSAT